jgi:hypothetical protein
VSKRIDESEVKYNSSETKPPRLEPTKGTIMKRCIPINIMLFFALTLDWYLPKDDLASVPARGDILE